MRLEHHDLRPRHLGEVVVDGEVHVEGEEHGDGRQEVPGVVRVEQLQQRAHAVVAPRLSRRQLGTRAGVQALLMMDHGYIE